MESNFIRSRFVYQLPPGARVSKDCRDLLLRLLERNPDSRITFAEFFAHPFVDLEHMSSAESLTKAVREQRAGAACRVSRWVICGVTDWAHAHMWLHVRTHVCCHAWLGRHYEVTDRCSDLHLSDCNFRSFRRRWCCRPFRRTRRASDRLLSLSTAVPSSTLCPLFTVRATSTLISCLWLRPLHNTPPLSLCIKEAEWAL